MKSLKICSLMLALGTSSIWSIPVHAQQDVDPDHFDQPSTFSRHVQGSNPQSHHTATAAERLANRERASAHSHPIRFGKDGAEDPSACRGDRPRPEPQSYWISE